MDLKLIHSLITDVWKLVKQYGDIDFQTETWAQLAERVTEIQERYKQEPEHIRRFVERMLICVQELLMGEQWRRK